MPGEDCASAHLWEDNMKWYDIPCHIRGFHINDDTSASINPLCEHEPFHNFQETYKVEGIDQVWNNTLNIDQCESKYILFL